MAIFSKIFVLTGLLAIANTVNANFQGSGQYTISNVRQPGLVIDLAGGNPAQNSPVDGYALVSPTIPDYYNEVWDVVEVSSDPGSARRYLIINHRSSSALSNSNPGSPSSNTLRGNKPNLGDSTQYWTLDTTTAPDQAVIIRSVGTQGQVVDLSGGGSANGTPVIGYPLNGATGTSNQWWNFTYLKSLP